MENTSKPKQRKKPTPQVTEQEKSQTNPRKYGTLSSPISFGLGVGSVNLNTTAQKKQETTSDQIPVPVPSLPVSSNLGIGMSSLGVAPHLSQLPVRTNPELTLGGVRKEPVEFENQIEHSNKSTEDSSLNSNTTNKRMKEKGQKKVTFEGSDNLQFQLNQLNEQKQDKSESPFASGPPSSSNSSYNRLKKLDDMDLETTNLQPSTSSKNTKQNNHMEIDQGNPNHPLLLSSNVRSSISHENLLKSEVISNSSLKEEEDPFGLKPKVSFLNQGDISLIQLPSALPSVLSNIVSDSSSNSKSVPPQSSEQNDSNSNTVSTQQGYLGKLLIFKSGKMKLQIGEFLYDVKEGTEGTFLQQVVALSQSTKQCYLLGGISNRLVCVPDFESLLFKGKSK